MSLIRVRVDLNRKAGRALLAEHPCHPLRLDLLEGHVRLGVAGAALGPVPALDVVVRAVTTAGKVLFVCELWGGFRHLSFGKHI